MRRVGSAVAGWIGALVVAQTLLAAEPAPFWQKSLADAQAASRDQQRPLLIHLYGPWCVPCRQMDAKTLQRPELHAALRNQVVAVKVDIEAHQDIGRKYGVETVPYALLLSPDGQLLARIDGYQSLADYQNIILRTTAGYRAHLARNPRPPAARPAGRSELTAPSPKINVATAPLGKQPDIKSRPTGQTVRLTPPEPAVGIDGFCPVTLWNTREWIKGSPEITAEHQGVSFHFRTVVERDEFRADPGRFAPQLLGCDPVVLWETDRAIAGTTRYAAFYEGELFLFETAESRRRFKEFPPRYTQTRHVFKLDQIERRPLRTGMNNAPRR